MQSAGKALRSEPRWRDATEDRNLQIQLWQKEGTVQPTIFLDLLVGLIFTRIVPSN